MLKAVPSEEVVIIWKGTESMTPKSGTTESVSFAGDWLQKWRIGKNDFLTRKRFPSGMEGIGPFDRELEAATRNPQIPGEQSR
jgi:hypothetical protein